MPRSFLAYIDESGDEGFVFKSAPEKGSSDWFILSAVVVPTNQDNIIRLAAADMRVALKMEPKAAIHFSDLTYDKRVCAIEKISVLPVKIVSVIINKHAIKKRALFRKVNIAYIIILRAYYSNECHGIVGILTGVSVCKTARSS
jgi:Protein of unknown function (DUF3800)